MPDLTYREKQDQKRLESIRTMLLILPRSCADFIRSLLSTTSTLTRLAYTIDLGTFFDFAMKELTCFTSENASQVTDEEIARLKPRDIEIYADYLSLYFRQTEGDTAEQRMFKNHTYGVMRKLSSLRSFFNYLFRTQRIPANIVTLVPLPKKHEKPILLLERDEMQKLLGTVYSGEQLTPQQAAFHKLTQVRDFAIVMLFLGTGIRVSECVGIDLEDLDFRNNALLVTRKGGNQVILYYPKEVADALRAYLDQRESIVAAEGHEHAFFLSLQKRRITQRAVEQMVKKYAMLVVPLKKRMSPHKLRSTYATNLYQETEDIYLVAEVLGHSDVNTTRKHYASMSDARMRDAARNTHLGSAQASEGENPDEASKISTATDAVTRDSSEAKQENDPSRIDQPTPNSAYSALEPTASLSQNTVSDSNASSVVAKHSASDSAPISESVPAMVETIPQSQPAEAMPREPATLSEPQGTALESMAAKTSGEHAPLPTEDTAPESPDNAEGSPTEPRNRRVQRYH